jgi:hypothetical protein
MTERFSELERRFQTLEHAGARLTQEGRESPRDEPAAGTGHPAEARPSTQAQRHSKPADEAGQELSSPPPPEETPGPADEAAGIPRHTGPETGETRPPAAAADSQTAEPGDAAAPQPGGAAGSNGSDSPPPNTPESGPTEAPS